MDEILNDTDSGKIHLRDKWQFELKSDLFPLSHHRNNIILQEFYFFIPNSLQINEYTYSNSQFYCDQTNLIRFKTPSYTLKELIDPAFLESPLTRLRALSASSNNLNKAFIFDEVKLLGNVFHSALRNQMNQYIKIINKPLDLIATERISEDFIQFFRNVDIFCEHLVELKQSFILIPELHDLLVELDYIEEFIRLNIYDYYTTLLYRLRVKNPHLKVIDNYLCERLLIDQKSTVQVLYEAHNPDSTDDSYKEFVLYRKGLLNKFVIDPLLLKSNRSATPQRYRLLIGAIPAGVAMLIYLSFLFLWQGPLGKNGYLLVNSQVLILLTVIVYILKDRIKEELKQISYQKATQWFSDYQTDILSQEDINLGYLKESFYFIDETKLPSEVIDIRHRQFHNVLETIKRPEKIIYYKKNVNIKKKPKTLESRFYGLNIIFRFDIHHFLAKSENPYHTYLKFDPITLKLSKVQLPRVYHINIILKNTKTLPDGKLNIEWNKYRLIVDKNGIKRIEQV